MLYDLSMKHVPWCKDKVSIAGIALSDYHSERAFQVFCATYLRQQYELTKDRRFAFWHHSANERENARESFYAKLMGQQKGFPDFINCECRIALELKVEKRKPSKQQKLWLKYFKDIGWRSEVVHTFESFKEIVQCHEK